MGERERVCVGGEPVRTGWVHEVGGCDWHSDLAFLVLCVCVCERIMDGSFGRIVVMWGGWTLAGW